MGWTSDVAQPEINGLVRLINRVIGNRHRNGLAELSTVEGDRLRNRRVVARRSCTITCREKDAGGPGVTGARDRDVRATRILGYRIGRRTELNQGIVVDGNVNVPEIAS